MKFKNMKQIIEKYKGVAIIEYPFKWGGQFQDKRFWQATINGDVYDFHYPEILIEALEKEGYKWIIVRHHKDTTSSIIKSSEGLS